MIFRYNDKIAICYGINSALIAEYFWHNRKRYGRKNNNKLWFCASRKNIAGVFPFMSTDAVGCALKRLLNAGIIIKQELNDSSFDRTLSYAFTTYGKSLMEDNEYYE